MKTLKSLICSIAVVAVVAFCAPSARAIPVSFTTNSDVLSIAAIIETNIITQPSAGVTAYTVHKIALNNAGILDLLQGADWYNGPFPKGSKLVMGFDAGENVTGGTNGDVLVVDKTGRTVLYDASEKSWSHSGKASLSINFYNGFGAYNLNINTNMPGHFDFTLYGETSFQLYDGVTKLSLYTDGPSTEVSSQNGKNLVGNDFSSWSDSVHASTYGSHQDNGTNSISGAGNATVSVKISAGGHGPGVGGYFYDNLYPH